MARYALIVGIETYNSQYLQDLSKSVIDAKDFAQILENYGNCPRNHITLLSGQVTGDEFIKALKTFLSEQAKNQDAIIYFSGHGILEKQQDPLTDEVSQKGYLAASDCQLSKKENQWVVKDNAIPLESITKLINHTELSSLIIILDACHGGALIQEINHSFNIFQNNTTYYFIAACQSYEDSWARKSKRHSEFTGALIEALSQDKADDDGIVTIGQAFEQASKRLETGRQEPTFMGKGSRLPLVKYSVTSLLKTVSKSAQIPDNDLEILQPYLEQIDRPILTWAMMEGVSAYALNHWLALDEALSIDSFLTVIREQFPQKLDGTSSIISVLHVLSHHPRIAAELKDQFKGWLKTRNYSISDSDRGDNKEILNACLLVVIKQEHPHEPLQLTTHLQLEDKAPIPILLKPDPKSPYQSHSDNSAIITCQVSVDETLEEKISHYLQDLFKQCGDIYLRGSPGTYNLVIELFLPFDYLAESVDLWLIPRLPRRKRQLGREYRVIVRSYERLFDAYYADKLEGVWKLMKVFKEDSLPTRIKRLEQEKSYCYSGLEQELTEQQTIGLSCFLPESEMEREDLFFALYETGVPLALWLRSRDLENDDMSHFDHLLCAKCLLDHNHLIDQLWLKRKAAYGSPNPPKQWGYHAAMLLDNPERNPPLNPLRFGQ
ncbi:VMAP-C domain-containing protein [Coleofasciculus sp.]|uniref:VMAP-C domain-containing protein n=1 Tax=Coleofasciculus sp. TaxID=3100458 RepID=UPI003A2B5EFA